VLTGAISGSYLLEIANGTCDIWSVFAGGHYILGRDTTLAENG
jgi:hypothetical protein